MKRAQQRVFRQSSGNITMYCWYGDNSEERRNVVLVHGWSSRAAKMAAFVEPLLDAGFNVFTWDQPAHGKSDGSTTNIGQMGQSLRNTVREIGPVYGLLTHSFGGMTAVTALGDAPESAAGPPFKVERLIMVSPMSNLYDLFVWWTEQMGVNEKARQLMHDRITKMVYYPWIDHTIATLMPDYSLPKLVIHCQDDKEISYEDSQSLSETLSDTQLILTSGLGHRRIRKDPDVIAQSIEFLLQD